MFKAKASTNITLIEAIIINVKITRDHLPYLRLNLAKQAKPIRRLIRYPKFISIAKYTRLATVNINRAIISAICTIIIYRRIFRLLLSYSSYWNLCHTLLSKKQKHTALSIRYFFSSLGFYSGYSNAGYSIIIY